VNQSHGDGLIGEAATDSGAAAGLGPAGAPARCRKFGIFDAMIVLAGLAVALAAGGHLVVLLAHALGVLGREVAAHRDEVFEHWPLFWLATRRPLITVVSYAGQILMMLLLGMTPTFLVLRLRRPRPPWRVLLRQGGMAAALAIVFGLFWVTGALVILFPPSRVDSDNAAPLAAGGTVAAVWMALALSRRGAREAGWIDRMGRLLGGAAIGAAAGSLVLYRL
jgi:hypothetical protein